MKQGIPFKMTHGEAKHMYCKPENIVVSLNEVPAGMVHIQLVTEAVLSELEVVDTKDVLEQLREYKAEIKRLNGDLLAYKSEGDTWRRIAARRLGVELEPAPKAPLAVLGVMRAEELSRLALEGSCFKHIKTSKQYFVSDVVFGQEGDMMYVYTPVATKMSEDRAVYFSRPKVEFLAKFSRMAVEA